MAGIFNSAIFNDAIFNTASADAEVEVSTGGKGDNDGARRSTFKPTGLLHRPQPPVVSPAIQARLEDSRNDAAEIAERLASEFREESKVLSLHKPVAQMSLDEIESEIGARLRDKMRAEDEELFMLVMAAAVA